MSAFVNLMETAQRCLRETYRDAETRKLSAPAIFVSGDFLSELQATLPPEYVHHVIPLIERCWEGGHMEMRGIPIHYDPKMRTSYITLRGADAANKMRELHKHWGRGQ